MLLTNQRLDKLSASYNDFVERGMLPAPRSRFIEPNVTHNQDDDGGPVDDDRVTGHVVLARTPGECQALVILSSCSVICMTNS